MEQTLWSTPRRHAPTLSAISTSATPAWLACTDQGTPPKLAARRQQCTFYTAGTITLTGNDLFFPDTVLIVDEPLLANAVAKCYQILAHLLQRFFWDDLAALQLLQFHHFFLAPTNGHPRVVKGLPQLDPLFVQALIVRCKAWVYG